MIKRVAGKLSKDLLREEFAKEHNKYYFAKTFEEKGFTRQRCKICGKNFWSIAETDDCGDASHTEYGFFRDKPREVGYAEFWNKFSKFFKENGHGIIKRYPVVSRWRPDLYFTIAGIQDFQRLENGRLSFEYNENPLLVPQMCMRFSDLENSGVTGRHFTSFIMANQTAFNYPKEGYWRDKTIKLNFEFLTKVLDVPEEDIIYHEDVWAMPDFSGFGPSLENVLKGLEVCTNVFTQFGLSGNTVSELDSKVVDVGWGFERLMWYYSGHPNAFEAVFGNTLARIRKEITLDFDESLYRKFAPYAGRLNREEVTNYTEEEAKVLKLSGISKEAYDKRIKPLQALYATIDYSKTLLFAVTDGSLPSNVGGGYNLRLILRRSFDFLDKYKINLDIATIAKFVAKDISGLYPELSGGIDTLEKVVRLERQRYDNAKAGAKRAVELMLDKGEKITREKVKILYESKGVTPELIENVAALKGVEVKLPEDVYTDIIQKDMIRKEKEQKEVGIEIPEGIKETKKLYYDFTAKADARVLFSKGRHFILDRTPFYPESGGQVQDTGTVNGIKVIDVQKIGDVVIHVADKDTKFRKGDKVVAIVDEERRKAIIAHHTAAHLISSACRRILGPHAWQEGSKKEQDKAHLDIAHYDKLSGEDVKKIEELVNSWLINGIRVSAHEMSRGEAESKYGFTIYQGHGAPSKTMRIVTIKTLGNDLIDAEACGGLHAIGKESYIGMVKIIGTSRIHDGVDRIEFVAGPALLKLFQEEHAQTGRLSARLNVESGQIGKRVEELLAENSSMHKQIEKSSELVATSTSNSIGDAKLIDKELDFDRKTLIRIADLLTRRNENSVVMLRNSEGYVVCIAGNASEKSAIDVLNEKLKGQFSGGGSKRFAEGKIKKV